MLKLNIKILIILLLSNICFADKYNNYGPRKSQKLEPMGSPAYYDNMLKEHNTQKMIQKKMEEKAKLPQKPLPPYPPLKINYNKETLEKEFKLWKKNNTGVYTYICFYDSPDDKYHVASKLVLIKNNKYVIDIVLRQLKKHAYKIDTSKDLNTYSHNPYFQFGIGMIKKVSVNSHRMDDNFKGALFYASFKPKGIDTIFHDGYEINLKYDKHHFITKFSKMMAPNLVERHMHTFTWNNINYGYLKLPKETKFTPVVVDKILFKYKQAWECSGKNLAIEGRSNYEDEHLESISWEKTLACLDRYLVWE